MRYIQILVVSAVKICKQCLQISSRTYTVNRKNTKMLLIYSLQNLNDCDKIWVYIVLSKFVTQKCKRFPPHLYSVSTLSVLAVAFSSEQQLELWTEKHQNVLSDLLQNEADSHKVWHMFSWLYLL